MASQVVVDILVGFVASLMVWWWSQHEGADRAVILRWAHAVSLCALILGAVLALLTGRTLSQEFLAKRSYLSSGAHETNLAFLARP